MHMRLRNRHRRPLGSAAVVVAAATAVALAGCSAGSSTDRQAAVDPTHGGPTTVRPTHSTTPKPHLPRPTVSIAGGDSDVSWRGGVILAAENGTIATVTVSDAKGDVADGRITSDGSKWASAGHLLPGTSYTARVVVENQTSGSIQRVLHFSTTDATQTISMSATPGPSAVVGVGEPIAVQFSRPVVDRASVERAMSVTTSKGHVQGAWHWFSSTSVHFRPKHYWPADSQITVHVDLEHVYAGGGLWGDRDHDWSFRTGDARVSYVSATKHRFRYTVNGKTIGVWPTGMGQPGFETRSGTYVVLGKAPTVEMTSCSIGLSCTPGHGEYYDLHVHWDTRLTWTGTFVHAAPWDYQLGKANTSHGCIHLSTQHAKLFYDHANTGDVVVVTGTNRSYNPTDAGMMDWNLSWPQWLAGSALH